MPSCNAELAIFQGRCGDRNPRGMAGARIMGQALAARLDLSASRLGRPAPPLAANWDVELAAALPELMVLSSHMDEVLTRGRNPLTAMGRCAAAIATLPVVARHHPDAAVVWFDAHADSNTPDTSPSGYLGGVVLTGAAGRWSTGLGGDLDLSSVILVGARDIDAAERALISQGVVKHVPAGADLAERLRDAVAGRAVYVHLDCDVLEPGIVPTEYRVADGLGLDDLFRAAEMLAGGAVTGLEIAEFEDHWPETGEAGSASGLVSALEPLLAALARANPPA